MNQLEIFIYGGCKSCDYVGYFHFVGVQEGFRDIPDEILYNCEGCETTLGIDSILKDIV